MDGGHEVGNGDARNDHDNGHCNQQLEDAKSPGSFRRRIPAIRNHDAFLKCNRETFDWPALRRASASRCMSPSKLAIWYVAHNEIVKLYDA